jgi:hypothetical protein
MKAATAYEHDPWVWCDGCEHYKHESLMTGPRCALCCAEAEERKAAKAEKRTGAD